MGKWWLIRAFLLTLVASLAVAGCAGRPEPRELVGSETKVLLQASIPGGTAVLGQRSAGDLVLGVWKKSGEKQVFGRPGGQSTPAIGWLSGTAVVAGLIRLDHAQKAELLTDRRVLIPGILKNGAYLFTWLSPEPPQRFLLRVLDERGNELFRWPPLSSGPVA